MYVKIPSSELQMAVVTVVTLVLDAEGVIGDGGSTVGAFSN